jgi:SWI/SNF-related matrix-associated actin-dependent regulator 1 of chromatin subfamily A
MTLSMSEKLLPYQEVGAAFLAARDRAGLWDDMGLGKTAQAIRALDMRQCMKIMVVCPAAVRQSWIGEFAKFSQIARKICKGADVSDFYGWARGLYDVIVVSYEMAAKWAKLVARECVLMDAIVLDEAHYLKSDTTIRTRQILGPESAGDGLVQWACVVWYLTGTPIPNDPMDLHSILYSAGVTPLNRLAFTREYFSSTARTYSVCHEVKPDKVDELRTLIGSFSIRRTLATAGIQLPDIFITDTTIDGDTSAVKRLILEHPGLDQIIKDVLASGKGLSGLSLETANHVATLRRLIGEAKALPYAKLLLEEIHSCRDKVVVFGIHKAAIHTARSFLESHGIKCVSVTGDVREADRVANVQDFQNDPDCRVFFGNIRAAGVGLTLTASNRIDMLESDWTPAGNAQAIKRVHRITQKRGVRARFITLANSFDETVNKILAEKTERIAAVDSIGAEYANPAARTA